MTSDVKTQKERRDHERESFGFSILKTIAISLEDFGKESFESFLSKGKKPQKRKDFYPTLFMSFGGFIGGGSSGVGDVRMVADNLFNYTIPNSAIVHSQPHMVSRPPIGQPIFNSSPLSLAVVCPFYPCISPSVYFD